MATCDPKIEPQIEADTQPQPEEETKASHAESDDKHNLNNQESKNIVFLLRRLWVLFYIQLLPNLRDDDVNSWKLWCPVPGSPSPQSNSPREPLETYNPQLNSLARTAFEKLAEYLQGELAHICVSRDFLCLHRLKAKWVQTRAAYLIIWSWEFDLRLELCPLAFFLYEFDICMIERTEIL